MAKKEIKKEEELQQEVGEALSTTGQWIEDNSNLLTWIITGIVVVVLGVIAINNYVIKPKAAEASAENAKSVVYFQSGDFEKALNGDEAECIGFAQTADNYQPANSQHCMQVSATTNSATMSKLLTTSNASKQMM